jgi:hypothetical protein
MTMTRIDKRKAMIDATPFGERKEICRRFSTMGCGACLWASVECKDMAMYEPKTFTSHALGGIVLDTCKGYTYYD